MSPARKRATKGARKTTKKVARKAPAKKAPKAGAKKKAAKAPAKSSDGAKDPAEGGEEDGQARRQEERGRVERSGASLQAFQGFQGGCRKETGRVGKAAREAGSKEAEAGCCPAHRERREEARARSQVGLLQLRREVLRPEPAGSDLSQVQHRSARTAGEDRGGPPAAPGQATGGGADHAASR